MHIRELQSYIHIWNFNGVQTENDSYWQNNKFLHFAKCLKMFPDSCTMQWKNSKMCKARRHTRKKLETSENLFSRSQQNVSIYFIVLWHYRVSSWCHLTTIFWESRKYFLVFASTEMVLICKLDSKTVSQQESSAVMYGTVQEGQI